MRKPAACVNGPDASAPLRPHPNDMQISVLPVRASAGVVRAYAEHQLRRLGMPGLVETGTVVASELVTNAIKEHLRRCPTLPIVTRVRLLPDGRPRIEVWDRSVVPPKPREVFLLDEEGRGLFLTRALAEEVGYTLVPGGLGKVVWAVLS